MRASTSRSRWSVVSDSSPVMASTLPHSGGNSAFGDDGAKPYVAGGLHVCAAAELLTEARNGDDPDVLSVLLPKEGHRAACNRRLSVFDFRLHRDVPEYLFIDDLFNRHQFGRCDSAVKCRNRSAAGPARRANPPARGHRPATWRSAGPLVAGCIDTHAPRVRGLPKSVLARTLHSPPLRNEIIWGAQTR